MADPEGQGLLPVTPQSLDQFKAALAVGERCFEGLRLSVIAGVDLDRSDASRGPVASSERALAMRAWRGPVRRP
jgi:hypothetical protein